MSVNRFKEAIQQVVQAEQQQSRTSAIKRPRNVEYYGAKNPLLFRIIPFPTPEGDLWIEQGFRQIWATITGDDGASHNIPLNFSLDEGEARSDALYQAVRKVVQYNHNLNPNRDTVPIQQNSPYPSRIQERHQIVIQKYMTDERNQLVPEEEQGVPVYRNLDLSRAMFATLLTIMQKNNIRRPDGSVYPSPEQNGTGFIGTDISFLMELEKSQTQNGYEFRTRGDLPVGALPANYLEFVDNPIEFVTYTSKENPKRAQDIANEVEARLQQAENAGSAQESQQPYVAPIQNPMGQQMQQPTPAPNFNNMPQDPFASNSVDVPDSSMPFSLQDSQPAPSQPVQPAPVQPAPVQPTPMQPAPSQPVQPTPTQSAPTQPVGTADSDEVIKQQLKDLGF